MVAPGIDATTFRGFNILGWNRQVSHPFPRDVVSLGPSVRKIGPTERVEPK